MTRYVYAFSEGDGKNKRLLGGKGANLCEMTQIGLNVPPGFVISTEACLEYLETQALPPELMEQVLRNIQALELKTGKEFGGETNPLLVSVRSGSALSMPGMMDTILNLGLNQTTLRGLIRMTGNVRFGYDAYRRFIQLFGKVALGVKEEHFDSEFEAVKRAAGVKADIALDAEHMRDACERFLAVVLRETGKPFPEDVYQQLEISIRAVFNSWMGKRAVDYRREFHITPQMANGTAVNVVTMVFGNMGNDCATGVGFTRNPGTGENEMYGEYLVNAQGEDVVAGIRTPKPVSEMAHEMPELYRQLVDLRNKLESHYREVQDYEYTIEKGVLYCLQTRNGKMNAAAMVRSSVEMYGEGLISKDQALLRVDPALLEQLLHPRLDPNHNQVSLAQGLPASPGAASGRCVFDADQAEMLGRAGEKVILVREETKPEDIHGFFASQGILTSRGGKTSHAAVVARGMGKACVAGAEGIDVDSRARTAKIGDITLREGDVITIDGSNGYVYSGEIPTLPPEFSDELNILLGWADEKAQLTVMANGDTPDMARVAVKYGARGIGLCRTERMFNASERLPVVVEMIMARTVEERQTALDKLLPMQRQDFEEMFRIVAPNPVTIRLLDPPMHEFLPSESQLLDEIEALKEYRLVVKGRTAALTAMNALGHAQGGDTSVNEDHVNSIIAKKELMLRKVRDLHEVNPMLGHRGVRLGITYPEIYEMQIRAILEAEAACLKAGIPVCPEIMVPQVITVQELKRVRASVDKVRAEVENHHGIRLSFKFGTMIETVRACTRAGDLAELAEFFSFGTNDLTQAVYSFSREDAENKFLPLYTETGILHDNPFETLDVKGVGVLMQMSVDLGRATNPNLKVGICGEQGGDPNSIRFCHEVGINYVSCSPHRVPVARLAAAQALLVARGAVPQRSPAAAKPQVPVYPPAQPAVAPPSPAPQPASAVEAPTPQPATTQAAIKILASEPPAKPSTRVQSYIEETLQSEGGLALPAAQAVPSEAAVTAAPTLPVEPEPLAPAVETPPRQETRVEAAIRALAESTPVVTPPPAPVTQPASIAEPEPVQPAPTIEPTPVLDAPPAPAAPAPSAAVAATPSAAPSPGKPKGGALGFMSRALNAMKDIDKKTPPAVDNNALPTGTNHVEPKPQAPVQPAPVTPHPAPPEPLPAAPAFEPEPVQPIAPPAAPAVQPTPVAQAVPVAKPVEKSKGGFMGIMSKTLKAIKDIDKPS
jgi:pyruvate,orthophosphate dikinase